jgi:hypothetical protein
MTLTTDETLELAQRLKELMVRHHQLTQTVLGVASLPEQEAMDATVAEHLLRQAECQLAAARLNLGHCPAALAAMEDFLEDDEIQRVRDSVSEDLVWLPIPETREAETVSGLRTFCARSAEFVSQCELMKAREDLETAGIILSRAGTLLGVSQ